MTRQWKRHDWCQQLQRCIRHLTMGANHGNLSGSLQEDLKILGHIQISLLDTPFWASPPKGSLIFTPHWIKTLEKQSSHGFVMNL